MLITSTCLILIKFWIRERYKEIIVTVFHDDISLFSDQNQKSHNSLNFSLFALSHFFHNSSRFRPFFCCFSCRSSFAGEIEVLLKLTGYEPWKSMAMAFAPAVWQLKIATSASCFEVKSWLHMLVHTSIHNCFTISRLEAIKSVTALRLRLEIELHNCFN